ncbi:hypothetical protein A3E47_02705 [Candidatus Peribacteria bacterium RIFCSPHIGHO2_12_FULL_54_10]|nr:MAG: hypothetical protein A3E47_02705 [Candidatus Peribacteria bacterium RIFCSPHIGHO2_12_FULL_54_10]
MSDDTAPATKADIGKVKNSIQKLEGSFQRLDGTVQRLEDRFQGLEEKFQKLDGTVQRLDVAVQKLGTDVQRIEKKFDDKFARLYETDDQILAILGNIDKRLTPKIENHEHRITRLEEAVA